VKTIVENSAVSLGVVIAIIGAVVWLTTLYNQVVEIKQGQAAYSQDMVEIKENLGEIKGELRAIHRDMVKK
jgi:hypothetical protein